MDPDQQRRRDLHAHAWAGPRASDSELWAQVPSKLCLNTPWRCDSGARLILRPTDTHAHSDVPPARAGHSLTLQVMPVFNKMLDMLALKHMFTV